jgi:hypothetical protein
VKEDINVLIDERWEKMYNPVMLVAHLLDPRYFGRRLPGDGINEISEFINKYFPEDSIIIYSQMMNYRAKSGCFSNVLAWNTIENVDPITWWVANFAESAPELTQVAQRILTIPTSSAASERNWSAFAHIHDKKRNRLSNQTVFKLVYIYSNYKLQMPADNRKKIKKKCIDELGVKNNVNQYCIENESDKEENIIEETDENAIEEADETHENFIEEETNNLSEESELSENSFDFYDYN